MKCPNCGQPVDEQDIFCGECGTKLKDPSTDKSASSTDKDKAHTQAETSNTSQEHKEHLVKTDNEQHATHRYDQEGTTSNQARSESQNHQAQDHQPQDNQQATYKQRPHQNNSQQQNNSQPTQNHHANTQSSQNQQPQGTDFKQHSTDILHEMKDFFRTAFTQPDQVISSTKSFSVKTLVTLLVAGFILMAIFLGIMFPTKLLQEFNVDTGQAVIKVVFYVLIGLVVLFFVTYLLLLMINVKISLAKFLSEFVLINTIPVLLFFLGCLLMCMHAFSIAITVLILSLLMLMVTPVYLLAKNSHQHQLRMPVIYAILIYFIIIALILRIVAESFITGLIGETAESLNEIFDQASDDYNY